MVQSPRREKTLDLDLASSSNFKQKWFDNNNDDHCFRRYSLQDFALVIYQMNRMAEIGLTGLTHILRGGVRVEKNRNLCYVNTVNWKRIVSSAYYQDIHIEENEMVNMCPLSCPKHCPSLGDFYGSKKAARNCWSSTTCQIGKDNCYWF